VSVPFGENSRYDLIADKDGALLRVQVKTGRLRNGAIQFNCYSSHSRRNRPSCRTYAGEIEPFAVHCRDVDAIFLVPVEEVTTCGFLRWLPAKNGQNRRVRWAKYFQLSGTVPDEVGAQPEDGVSDDGAPQRLPL
jgi:hypothetical protein